MTSLQAVGGLTIETCAEASDWDDFVLQHPKGAVFHTAAMVRTFAAARRHHPLAIAARDDDGRLAALLVAVRIDTLGRPARGFASRSIFYAEPLCRDDEIGLIALRRLLEHHDRRMRGVLFSEVRPLMAPGPERQVLEAAGYRWLDYLNYTLDIRPSADELLANFEGTLRTQLRRNNERGVEVECLTAPFDVPQIFHFLSVSYARSKVPMADVSLFRAALAEFPPSVCHVCLIRHGGLPFGVSLSLAYKNRLFAWYCGSERIRGISADDSSTWEAIQWGKNHGLTIYDFGGAGWPDEEYGPRHFKKKFGGDLVRFGRYRKVFGPIRMKIAEAAYGAARRLAPSSASRCTSPPKPR